MRFSNISLAVAAIASAAASPIGAGEATASGGGGVSIQGCSADQTAKIKQDVLDAVKLSQDASAAITKYGPNGKVFTKYMVNSNGQTLAPKVKARFDRMSDALTKGSVTIRCDNKVYNGCSNTANHKVQAAMTGNTMTVCPSYFDTTTKSGFKSVAQMDCNGDKNRIFDQRTRAAVIMHQLTDLPAVQGGEKMYSCGEGPRWVLSLADGEDRVAYMNSANYGWFAQAQQLYNKCNGKVFDQPQSQYDVVYRLPDDNVPSKACDKALRGMGWAAWDNEVDGPPQKMPTMYYDQGL